MAHPHEYNHDPKQIEELINHNPPMEEAPDPNPDDW